MTDLESLDVISRAISADGADASYSTSFDLRLIHFKLAYILVNHGNLQRRKLRLDKPDQLITMGIPIRHGDNDAFFSDINW